MLHNENAGNHGSSHHHLEGDDDGEADAEGEDAGEGEGVGSKRKGRGRPKGSKNKPKLTPNPPPPKPPKPPPRPRGRPPKPRTPEEQADFEQRKEEKALGIKRKKGRPRKFPGYLVREMRLKKNRAEFNEVIRRHEMGLPLQHDDEGHEHGEGHHGPEHEVYAWAADNQSLLDAVGAAELDGRMEVDEEVPSGLGKSDGSIREVFGLERLGEVQ